MFSKNQDPSETVIDSWSVLYSNSTGLKHKGTLTVTSRRLLYTPLSRVHKNTLRDDAFYSKWNSENYLIIPISKIRIIHISKSCLKNEIILTLDNKTSHSFSKGYREIKKISKAILESVHQVLGSTN